jgi:glycerophosphoryl diester phosphodiesterase
LIQLRRPEGRFARVGHRGASALAPENTLQALELAVELGCDMLEFDVLDLADGTLVLAHSNDLREASHGAARAAACVVAISKVCGASRPISPRSTKHWRSAPTACPASASSST